MCNEAGYVSIMMAFYDDNAPSNNSLVSTKCIARYHLPRGSYPLCRCHFIVMYSRLETFGIRNASHAQVNNAKNSSAFAIQM